MCLHTEQSKPFTAGKDITCYKVVNPANMDGVFRSVFQEFAYSLGVKYVEKKFAKTVWSCTVHEGFHSYRTIDVARRHAFELSPYVVLIKCVIPKGSMYYESYTKEEYCSDTLIPVAWKPLWKCEWKTKP
jgi:hypothetical protein